MRRQRRWGLQARVGDLIGYWLWHDDRHYRLDKVPLVDNRRKRGKMGIQEDGG